MDGRQIFCASFFDVNVHNSYYQGYTQGVQVTDLLVYNFKGEIIHAEINYPGLFHDSKLSNLSGLLFPKLGDVMTPPGF